MSRNEIQWPSIGAFPKFVCAKVDALLHRCELAASVVQSAYRYKKAKTTETKENMRVSLTRFRWSARPSARLYASTLFRSSVHISEKYDGTNVGKDEEGNMYGRRLMIDSSADCYQRTGLDAVKEVDTRQLKNDVFAEIGAEEGQEDFTCVVYGELMCNKGLFDYQARDLVGGWFPFGAIIRHRAEADEEVRNAVRALYARLAAAGYACNVTASDGEDEVSDEDPVVQIKLMNCVKFSALVSKSGQGKVPKVRRDMEHAPANSMAGMVERLKGWMLSCEGEGVVISIAANPNTDSTTASARLFKWKTAAEPQGSNEAVITRTLTAVEALNGACVSAEIVMMLRTLLAVATALPPAGKNKNAKKDKQQAKQKPEHELAPSAVSEAIDSALTKFDALDVFFGKGAGGIKEIKSLLNEEVSSDMGAGAQKGKEKQIKVAIDRFVGMKLGNWKKSQA